MPDRTFHTTRRQLIGVGAALAGAVVSGWNTVEEATSAAHRLVEDNLTDAVIVVEEPDSTFVGDAAQELQATAAQATGVTIPIIPSSDSLPRSTSIRIGRGPTALQQMGADNVVLEPEEYWIKSVGDDLLIVGYDIDPATTDLPDVGTPLVYNPKRSPATLWGVHYLLDRYLGVRWLWPGPGGTVVPTTTSFSLPTLSVRARPANAYRQLRSLHHVGVTGPVRLVSSTTAATMEAEVHQWQERHQLGQRIDLTARHSFTDWWGRFSGSDPDYFAIPAAGYPQQEPGRVKLRLSNPAVADQIVADWAAAGIPDYWSVGPNDSTGFDTDPATMAMDYPPDQNPVSVWRGKTNLSARYVTFWNSLLTRMRQANPDVRLLSLAYSAYDTAPVPASGVSSADGLILSYTVAPWWNHEWQDWSDLGASLVLRPNWWNSGATSPVLPLALEAGFHEFAQSHGSVGFDYDSIYGGWGNQGLRYYLIARLNARPDLDPADVISEFVACFGAAEQTIRDYVAYWEAHTMQVSYPLGSETPLDPQGLYSTTVAEHGLSYSAMLGSLQILPFVYTDEVIAPATAMLDDATAQAGSDPAVQSRIQFLRDGLTELVAKRDTIAATYGTAEFTVAATRLRDLRAEMTPRHVVWGEASYWQEDRFNVRTYI